MGDRAQLLVCSRLEIEDVLIETRAAGEDWQLLWTGSGNVTMVEGDVLDPTKPPVGLDIETHAQLPDTEGLITSVSIGTASGRVNALFAAFPASVDQWLSVDGERVTDCVEVVPPS